MRVRVAPSIRLAADHQPPGDPRDLVGKRDGDLFWLFTLKQADKPGRGVLPLRPANMLDDGGGADNQRASEQLIAGARNAPEPSFAAGRMVLGRKAQPRPTP